MMRSRMGFPYFTSPFFFSSRRRHTRWTGDWIQTCALPIFNAAHARYLGIRRLLLLGRLDETEQALAAAAGTPLPPALLAVHELVAAGVAMRRLRETAARDAHARADRAAQRAGIPALMAEVDAATRTLHAPAARWLAGGEERLLPLRDVAALLASETFVVDACRHAVRHRGKTVPLASRPVLFALMRQLA